MVKSIQLALAAAASALVSCLAAQAHAESCERLAGQKIGGGVVVSAERMAPGDKLVLPGPAAVYKIPPLSAPICRVRALLSPVPDSEIRVEVWLPEAWNGKFVGTGGGGFSGGLDGAAISLNPLVAKGYAAAATDVGHPTSDNAKWAYKHPEKVVDWAHRGNHLTARFGKALADAYYAKPVHRAYFVGCSNGGRDALMEAWRYPDDYDAIVAGAPAGPWTRLAAAAGWNAGALDGPPAATLTTAKLKLVTDAIVARCDGFDGVKDGIIGDPRACRFDPAVLQCKAGTSDDRCLTPADIRALRRIYQGPRTRDGRQISDGLAVGGEDIDWASWLIGPKALQRSLVTDFFRWMVYDDPSWSLDQFNLDRDYPAARKRMARIVDADNPDLRPFLKHGGKLIIYHGWADPALAPGNTIAYYEAVRRRAPARADQVRLFMAPGMSHCSGGVGPSQVDWFDAIDAWSEGGKAPDRLVASKLENPIAALTGAPSKILQTRPLCAWPRQARWNGSGSTDDAANFSCVLPK